MKSTGNDIVALSSVDKQRTSQFRFYSKILSGTEQAIYHQPQFAELPFENYVWLLWSVKESVFKYLKRIIPYLVFSPTKIVIQYIKIPLRPLINKFESIKWESTGCSEGFYWGEVIYGSYTFYFQSKISEEWIASVVNDNEDFENVWWGIRSIDDVGYYHQSTAVRTLLLNKLNSFFTRQFACREEPYWLLSHTKGFRRFAYPCFTGA